jgi:4-hydroxy-tetrahydrodipicolinate synthase
MEIGGLFHVLVTPFAAGGGLDEASLRRVVAFAVEAGSAGLVALGVQGEAAHLDAGERAAVMRIVGDEAAGAVPVVVGVSAADGAVAAARAAEAAAVGASGVMVAVPPDADRLSEHVAGVAAAGLPVVLQDYPPAGHPPVPAAALADTAAAVPAVACVKAEDPPTPAKIRALAELAPRLPQLGGLGGLLLWWELEAGSRGAMTGFAYPEALAAIVAAHAAGDAEGSRRRYEAALPALVWEAQPAVGLALRKALLAQRGIIADARTRAPHPPVPDAAAQAASIAARMEEVVAP